MKALLMIAFILVIVGSLNWLVYALAGTDLGMMIGGMDSTPAKVIYVLVGLSGIYLAATHKKDCKACSSGAGGAM